ncbi:aldehyde ferredoxin oxidoreductase [Clostridium sediminicola]|uniref:aldehyde ferredoxin oxidoreductase family protein n=1 Tax=Clostridium sediminicola TaxID=3114879 RepID=UPI0031F1CEBA
MLKPRYVVIDLTNGKVKEYPISEKTFGLYLGGKSLGARILYDELNPGVDPLSSENIFIVNTGPLNGTGAPASSRFNITTKNVLTGGIASSNCGGTFGFKLRKAGFDGLIIKGMAPRPSYIEIVDGEITIKDASHLWGLDSEETQHKFDSRYGALVIGPAGENLVKYSCAVSGERVAGRCGVGAVMGSKNLKALVTYGTKEISIHSSKKFKKYIQKWIRFLRNHPATGKALPMYGTAGLVQKCNASGILPTKNFKRGTWDKAELISGEHLTENYLTRNGGCVSCPIRCERRVMVNDKEVKGPEFETIGLFGSNIENSDLGLINHLNYHADLLGMDTISLGGTLAFAMELQEKGIKDFGIRFGDNSNLIDVLYKIANREGIYSELADGTKVLCEKYGGEEFAIHSKGMELASYEPRKSVGMGLGYATSNRGACHLNGGYAALLENLGAISMDSITIKGKPEIVVLFQNLMEAISAAGFCLQTSQTLVPSFVFKLKPSGTIVGMIGKTFIKSGPVLGRLWKSLPGAVPFNSMYLLPHAEAIKLATGINMTTGKFLQAGERGYNIEKMFNIREGLSSKDDTLPERLTNVPLDSKNPDTVVKLKTMVPQYYKIRGWDENGIPLQSKLKQLGIEEK